MDFCKKKQKNVEPGSFGSLVYGDTWIFTSIKRGSYLFVSYSIGKRTLEKCREMLDKFFRRVQIPYPDKKLQIFTDGHSDYTTVLKEIYCETCLDYGQLIKVKKKGKLVAKQKWKIFGNPDWKDIETTDVENSNSIMRERNGRLVRKSKCFSKKKGALCYSIEFLQMYWNLMKPIHDKKTPALIEGLADTTWTWDDFFNYRLSTTD